MLLRTVASGDVDLSRADGRAVARTLAAWDAAEAERTGERVARAIKQRAEAGRNHGGKRAFGFRVVPGDVLVNGKRGPSTVELVPDEADAIRDAIDVVIAAGKEATIYKIARRWDEAGLRRVYGGLWAEHPTKLKECLINWKNAAVVVHKGQPLHDVKACWPAIVPVDRLEQVRAILMDPDRCTRALRPARSSMVSGLLRCGREGCGSPMRSSTHHGSRALDPARKVARTRSYRCSALGCGATISGDKVEPLVLEAVVSELLCRDLAATAEDPADAARLAELRAELTAVSEGRARVNVLVSEELTTLAEARGSLQALGVRHRAAEGEREAISRRVAPARFLQAATVELLALDDPGADARADEVMARFCELDLGVQRAILDAMVEVTVHPGHAKDRCHVVSRATGERIGLGWSAPRVLSPDESASFDLPS